KEGTRLAIAGDSITQQKIYSQFLETYLVACAPVTNISVIQLGWDGETAARFAARLENDLLPWNSTVVTLCYGMNDGRYRRYEESIGAAYQKAMAEILDGLQSRGVTAVVGGPGVVDSHYFTRTNGYNESLARLSAIAEELAARYAFPFADVHGAMADVMAKSKAALGETYPVGGFDGVHPVHNGHLVMAYAFLRALELEGDIGSIVYDWTNGATATGDHRILDCASGALEIESRRYPFCFGDTADDPYGKRMVGVLPFVPFQEELNRFTLTVRNLPPGDYEVCWGSERKRFDAERLARGINLAAEFIENPFRSAFARVRKRVAAKQAFETVIIKGVITQARVLRAEFQSGDDALRLMDELRDALLARHRAYCEEVRAAVLPVRHELRITRCGP
ncbi:MAG: SGNH/GDSL hydrolase family protein, partial [Lentisphaerae bacterium]|nr:SGNH/GDSL hydrolase family protein [Lentisphaerota bacterium]